MLKKMETNDIVKILSLNDDMLCKSFPCDAGEWVQFLCQHVDDPEFFMLCYYDKNDTLAGYIVVVNTVQLPLSNTITVLYSKTAGMTVNKKSLEMVVEWGRDKNAKEIVFITNNPVGHMAYGFKKKSTMMGMVI